MYYDIKIFQGLNNSAGQSKIVDGFGIFFAEYLPYLMLAYLLCFLFWPKKDRTKNRAMVVSAVIAAIVSRYVVKSLMILFYERPRPYINLPLSHDLVSVSSAENLQSFPSGHAIFFFALSMVIYRFNKKLGAVFFICSVVMSVSRIFVGVHWPSDILGGAILGIIVGAITFWLYQKNKNKFSS